MPHVMASASAGWHRAGRSGALGIPAMTAKLCVERQKLRGVLMTTWQLIRRGLAHHWRIHVAVALGVMAGTTVLTGALLVGDSVRGSLRDLALDRLGRVDEALVTPHFFRQELATEVTKEPASSGHFEIGRAHV